MSIVIGTLGTVDAKSAEVFNAFNLYELTFATAEFLVKYYEETENFREIVLSILLLYVDHIEQIRHWSNDHENVLQSLAEYLSRNLPLENREMIWQFIYDIHNLAEGNDMIEDIQYQISVIQYNLDLVTKLVGDNQDFYPWSKKWLTQKIQKQSFTMDQIRLF